MPREKEAYLDNLAAIREAYPERNNLTAKEVSRYLHKTPNTVRRQIPGFKKGVGYSVYTLARYLS